MADRDLVVTSITCILFTVLSFFTCKKQIASYFSPRCWGSLLRQTAGLMPLLGLKLTIPVDGLSAESSTRSTDPFHARLALTTRVAREARLNKHC